MKNRPSIIRDAWYLIIIIGLTTLLATSCSKNQPLDDVVPDNNLKRLGLFPDYTTGIPYHFTGMVNNDSIEIIIPAFWNGSFLVYAHGYVDPVLPIGLPNDAIAGFTIKTLLTAPPLGFAYASTSYSENGFAIKEGVKDVMFLGKMIKAHFKPDKIYLGGVSEGGLVALKALEQNQPIFNSGLISCAPVGDFQKQLQYFGDFHVLFKYYYATELANIPIFPGESIDIGSPEYVSPELMQSWTYGNLKSLLTGILISNPNKLKTLLAIAQVPVDVNTIPLNGLVGIAMEILRFNIMATNDMNKRVHGTPYDNLDTTYPTGFNGVLRIKGDKQALHRVNLLFETTGTPRVPIILMHTMGDHVVPAWHTEAYLLKVNQNEMLNNVNYLPIQAYGHCNYTLDQILLGIEEMVERAN